MDEVSCPMCGQSNPAELEVCQFCQARIKPLDGGAPPVTHDPSISENNVGSQAAPTSPGEAPDTGERLPDWLDSLRPGPSEDDLPSPLQEEPGESQVEESGSQAARDRLEWLSGLRSSTQQEPDQPESPPFQEADGLDSAWVPVDEPMQDRMEEVSSFLDEADELTARETAEASEPEPEWLHTLQVRQNLTGAGLEDSSDSTPELDGSQEQISSADDPMPVGSVPPFAFEDESGGPGEIPNWLSEFQGQEDPQEESTNAFTSEGSEPALDLEPAELPNWLEAMRPVETAAASHPEWDETDRLIESSGPLSGLRGVLPAEPDIAQVKKSTVYSTRLDISESQQSHVLLLEELNKAEGQPRPIPHRPSTSSQIFFRLIIFFVLFLGIAWPVYTGSQAVPLPALPAEIDDVSVQINSLSSSAPVLLAVDYQPGLSPELDAAAGAVVDHLMRKGAYLTIVTTTVTGPAQAERLIRLVSDRGGHQYLGIDQYANLGFIPGGAAGLLSFAETPQRISPYVQEGSYAWEMKPLQAVDRIADFGLVLVITENPDTARAWIEQVQPSLGTTPLLMVLSAQAEPVVRPYYDSSPRQVEGFVAGLAGGAAYEKQQARMGLARKYWDSFSTALLLAAGLIIIGGAANLVTSALPKRKKAGGDGPV